MLDVNMIIANNIQAELRKENKKQVDLAEGIGVSKQTMSKIMNGARATNAIEQIFNIFFLVFIPSCIDGFSDEDAGKADRHECDSCVYGAC